MGQMPLRCSSSPEMSNGRPKATAPGMREMKDLLRSKDVQIAELETELGHKSADLKATREQLQTTTIKLKALQDTVLSLNLHMDKLKYEMLALESKFPAQQQQQQQQQAPRAESDRLDFSIRA